MLKHFKWATPALAGAVLLSGCGGTADKNPTAEAETSATDTTIGEATIPDEAEAQETATPVQAVVAQTDGQWTDGTYTLKIEGANLRFSNERLMEYHASMPVRFENGSNEPVGIVIARGGEPSILFSGGLRGHIARNGLQLLQYCNEAIEICQSRHSDRLVEIAPGSTLSFNVVFRGLSEDATRDEIKEISSGTINMKLYVISGSGVARTLDVAIVNTPIQNRIQ